MSRHECGELGGVNPIRVLAVTSEPPWPLTSGGHIRTFHLLRSLAASTQLRLLCPVLPHQRDTLDPIRRSGIDLRAVNVNQRGAIPEARRLMTAYAKQEPYVMYRRHAWPEVAAVWRDEVQTWRPDVLYFDHLDAFVYRSSGGRAPACPAVIDLHNVYSLLVRRAGSDQPSRVKRAFLNHQATLLERIERRAVQSCDAVLSVSHVEADHFRAMGAAHVVTVPNGVDCAAFGDLPAGRTGPPTIAFLGTMSWGPNASAAQFLAREVLPPLRQRIADARLLILGRDPPPEIRRLGEAPGVEVTGTVPEVKPYLRQAATLAVPLDSGGGTRLKILEAFAAGLPVVSTAVGAEGISAKPGKHFVLAERPSFVDALELVLTNRETSAEMARAARALAHESYDWPMIGALATTIVKRLGVRSVIPHSEADPTR